MIQTPPLNHIGKRNLFTNFFRHIVRVLLADSMFLASWKITKVCGLHSTFCDFLKFATHFFPTQSCNNRIFKQCCVRWKFLHELAPSLPLCIKPKLPAFSQPKQTGHVYQVHRIIFPGSYHVFSDQVPGDQIAQEKLWEIRGKPARMIRLVIIAAAVACCRAAGTTVKPVKGPLSVNATRKYKNLHTLSEKNCNQYSKKNVQSKISICAD